MTDHIPKLENAPGHIIKPRKWGWEIRWRARTDLVRKGYLPKSLRLWISSEKDREPTEAAKAWISDRCRLLQDDMLVWGRGGLPVTDAYDGTIAGLILAYQNDPDSPYLTKLRPVTRDNYEGLCRRLSQQYGTEQIANIKARQIMRWHEGWGAGGKVSIAHSMVTMLRILSNFGASMLESDECERLSNTLHRMKFPQGKPRTSAITAEQVTAIRAMAHTMGYPSVALAQAFQFECMLRQKDVIGERVSLSEPGISDVIYGNEKWLRGLRWEEIDQNLVLHHMTSKRNKITEPPLREAPMVMDELRLYLGLDTAQPLTRDMLPASGPIVISDNTEMCWDAANFRKVWRKIARACGVPDDVKNMDNRAGAISEATDAGIDLHKVQHAATHGDISMTQRYSRNSASKTAEVMIGRAGFRKKND